MTPDAVWFPEGASRDGARDALDRVLDGWMGLTLNEGSISKRVKLAVLHHLNDGFIVGERWFESADEAVKELNGSTSEKELALMLMKEASGSGIRISKGGEVNERGGDALEIAATSCNDVLSGLWVDHGFGGLIGMGIVEVEAEDLWAAQCNKKRAFGKFLNCLLYTSPSPRD